MIIINKIPRFKYIISQIKYSRLQSELFVIFKKKPLVLVVIDIAGNQIHKSVLKKP